MLFDFLIRGYAPHIVLGVVASLVFFSQPRWPDERWATPYAGLTDRYEETRRRQLDLRTGSTEWVQAEQERISLQQQCLDLHARLMQPRLAVVGEVLKRAGLIALLTALCYILTGSLVSSGDGSSVLPEGQSFLYLLVGIAAGTLVASWVASSDARVAAVLFALADGVALTCLLFGSDALSAFEKAGADAERQEEERQAELRGGTSGARREAEQFFAAHRKMLQGVYPEVLWRASINAAIPEGIDAVEAWAATRKLIKQLQPHIEEAQRLIREKQERARQRARERLELLAEIGRCTAQIEEVRGSPLDEDVIKDEESGLQKRIGQLKKQLAVQDSLNDEGDQT